MLFRILLHFRRSKLFDSRLPAASSRTLWLRVGDVGPCRGGALRVHAARAGDYVVDLRVYSIINFIRTPYLYRPVNRRSITRRKLHTKKGFTSRMKAQETEPLQSQKPEYNRLKIQHYKEIQCSLCRRTWSSSCG